MTPDPPATEDVFGQLATTHGGRIRRRTRRARHDHPGDASTARNEEGDNFVAGAGAGARADR
jgi:hypothetical protein